MSKRNVVLLKDIQKYIDKCKNKSIQVLRCKNPNIVEAIYWTSKIGHIEQRESMNVSGWNYNTEETIQSIKNIK